MTTRTTTDKEVLDVRVHGDDRIGEVLRAALHKTGEVQRWTHGFHTYPAGLHPDASRVLLKAFASRRVVDPFCGGGTALIEARAAGLETVGRDINPVALLVAKGRTTTATEEQLTAFRSAARRITDAALEADELPHEDCYEVLASWYASYVLCELEGLRRGIEEADASIRPLLELVFSSILVKTSWRRSDTNPQHVTHDRPPETTSFLFHKKARELARRIRALSECVPEGTPVADIKHGDARELDTAPADLVLTSPPYPSTYDYVAQQHLRHVWFGRRSASELEVGSRKSWRANAKDALAIWHQDTLEWTQSAADTLEPGGHLVVIIGNGRTNAGDIDAAMPTRGAAEQAGLTHLATASVKRPDHARGDGLWEHAFAFQKQT